MPLKHFAIISIVATCFACTSCSDTGSQSVSIEKEGQSYVIKFDGDLFTKFQFDDQKSFLYPVIGPTGVHMTRRFPMEKDVPGESQDHPWHSSVYYAHGAVNGLDFWNERSDSHNASRIILDKVEKAENLSPDQAQLIVSHQWVHKDEIQMTDRTEILFSGDADKRIIDYKVTLIASHGDVELGDTKEGCMAIRMNPKFRVRDQGAQAINSAGDTGKSVWGKKAKWITYSNEIDGTALGISMFDHPGNPRYPTTWHARDYGLCAANAFGLKYFMKDEGKVGDMTLKNGERLTFSYRLVFHKGSHEEARIDQLHTAWAKQ
ncbi:MAG: PmoA family protein [Verrucomicrobiota bacterium]